MADISDRLEALIQTIQNVSSLGASFVYDVGKLLESFGYTLQDGDNWLLGFCIQKVENNIKNECNVSSVPCGLKKVASQMVIGEFLFAKKGIGQLQGLNIDIDAAVKQIQEGDTSVTFAFGNGSMTPEQRLDMLIAYLVNSGISQFVRYRRLKW
jgi:hypothetical protein